MLSTRGLPIGGELRMRCIDSQFSRYDSRASLIAMRSRSSSATSSTVRERPSCGLEFVSRRVCQATESSEPT